MVQLNLLQSLLRFFKVRSEQPVRPDQKCPVQLLDLDQTTPEQVSRNVRE